MRKQIFISGLVVLGLLVSAGGARAFGVGDLKKKAEEKAKKAAEKAEPKEGTPSVPAPESKDAPPKGGAAGGGGDKGDVSSVSTKFDFVPGDKILLMDDFTRDELGEFPSRWKLWRGNFDIVEYEGARWFRLNGEDGTVSIKSAGLPDKWTLEFDYYHPTMIGPVFTVGALYPNLDSWIWYAPIGGVGGTVAFSGPDGTSSTAKASDGVVGKHHVSVMAAGRSLKIYLDRERLVNIPEMVLKPDQIPAAVGIRFWRYSADPLITNVRFAEGGKPKVDMMAAPFVTHGIVFDSGSDRIKPESAPVLRQVAAYLKENGEVKVMITGHTDDVGEKAANQTLSEQRAAAVAASLGKDFGIDAARLSTSGKGESAPIAPNDSPEGKATNRRVEFAKN